MKLKDYVRFKDLMAATMKITVVWDETPCTLADHYQHFGVKIHTAEYSSHKGETN
jgi:hypothetical protein